MFSSLTADKSSGLFAGISETSSANLFQVLSTADSKASNVGLFGAVTSSTTGFGINLGLPTYGFQSPYVSGEENVKPGNLFESSGGYNNLQKDQENETFVANIYTNDDMLSSDFDSSKTNTDVKGSNSNDLQNVDHMYWPAVKLSRLPIGCNTKCYLQNQFQRFGHIERIICQPSMDAAYVAFDSLSSAQRAKRSGRESVLPGDGGLPSSVLLTMARIRCHPTSGSSSISPKLASNSSGSMKSHFTSIRPSGLKRPILSHLHSKPVLSKKHVSNLSASSSDELAVTLSSTVTENLSSSSSPSSSSQLVCSTPPIISPISLSNTSTYNNSLFSQKSIFATTLDERLCLLQECYKRDCDLRSSSKSVDSNIQYSDVGNTDEPVHHAPIKGTCEDMCPELERYLRAVHQRVSIFECLPTTINSNSSSWEMDHTRAVKDYQRSSADQPVPLPRELRPTHVLQRTMAYLLASIADRPEIDTSRSLWKPWYEFMWTRTRAIRKDVRQQNLCCPIVIGVIERIARFHIFCAARLVDQPVDSFDPRINSENLTQCLQTLKEMYSDLDSLNSSENLCPNEAEFRAYMLLMKLNDQNEINEAQRLPDCLRRSKPVRFAFATHEALITNNYIRFFRLARQATCLVACLMHRYFVQIRGQALMRLSCAFAGHPKREVHYPISTLTKQLGFENEEESRDFCERWGLTAKGSSVIFEKQVQPQPPELPWREKRSFQLIENKRISTRLSELFNGSPVNPSDAIPPPVKSSFGTNGVYIGSHDKNAEVNSNNTVTGGIYDSRVDENNNRYNSVKHPIISSSMFTSIQQTTVNPSTLMSSSTTRINIQNGERPMITDQLLEWIFEECVDEVIQFSKLAQTVLLESITIDELVEKLLIDVIKEHIVNIFNKTIKQANQLCKQIAEIITNEILDLELYNLVHRELTLEFIYKEFIDQLIDEQLHRLATSSLTKSMAMSLYDYSLIKRCFNRFHYVIWKREEVIQHQILLNTMPTPVGADCLPLRLMTVNNQIKSNMEQFKLSCNLSSGIDKHSSHVENKSPLLVNSMTSRFLPEISKLDGELTWSVLRPSSLFIKYPLGIYSSILIPTHGCSSTVQQHLTSVAYWIHRKLIHFPLVLLNDWPDSCLSKKLSGIIVIGQFDQSSITREQLMLMIQSFSPTNDCNDNNSNNNEDNKEAVDRLLVLAITISLHESVDSLQGLQNTLHDDDGICLLRLTNHISSSGYNFLPNPYWSVNLQHSLQWFEDCCSKTLDSAIIVGSKNHRNFQSNHIISDEKKYSTAASLSSLVSSSFALTTEAVFYTELDDLIHQYIDESFLRPLADLSRSWKLHDLVDPSLKSLIDAYHFSLSHLLDQLTPVNKDLTNTLHDILFLSKHILHLINMY